MICNYHFKVYFWRQTSQLCSTWQNFYNLTLAHIVFIVSTFQGKKMQKELIVSRNPKFTSLWKAVRRGCTKTFPIFLINIFVQGKVTFEITYSLDKKIQV